MQDSGLTGFPSIVPDNKSASFELFFFSLMITVFNCVCVCVFSFQNLTTVHLGVDISGLNLVKFYLAFRICRFGQNWDVFGHIFWKKF